GHDAWAHFSDVLMPGYRVLEAGDRVAFEIVRQWQDGFDYVATDIRPLLAPSRTPGGRVQRRPKRRVSSRDIRDGKESGAGMPTGRTRPLWMALILQPAEVRTRTMVCRDRRRLGSLRRHGIRTEAVPWTTATSGVTYRIDSRSPTRAEPASTPRKSRSWLCSWRCRPRAIVPSYET